MRVVLLANGWVGLQVVRYLREHDPPVGLVLHEEATAQCRDEIVTASGLSSDDVLVSEQLHEPKALARLRAWAPDLIVSAWYGSILKREVLAVAPMGGVNLHPSYLPHGRGKFPNVWSIIEGTPAGATIHFMDEGIDTGDIIKRKEVPVDLVDTGASLYEKLQRACAEVFIEAWPGIRSGTAPRIPQSEFTVQPTFHRAKDVEKIDEIDMDATYVARELIDLLRARTFKPHPSAYVSDGGRQISLRLELSEQSAGATAHQQTPERSGNDDRLAFETQMRTQAADMGNDAELLTLADKLYEASDRYGFSYFWRWLGLPVIQTPDDIVVTQEIIWQTKPQVVVETGFARGGSAILYSSILELVGEGRVVSVDVDIRQHNRRAVEGHPFGGRVDLVEGSSTAPDTVERVRAGIPSGARVMVILDSNHTHEHVLNELRLYGPLVTEGQFLVVSDTVLEDIPRQTHRPREWGPGNNPKTALQEYLRETDRFEPDSWFNSKGLITSSRGGYLRCVAP